MCLNSSSNEILGWVGVEKIKPFSVKFKFSAVWHEWHLLMFNRDTIAHVSFQQRVALDICFEHRNRLVILFLMENIAKKEKKERFFFSKF
jgi:hypothetical protein